MIYSFYDPASGAIHPKQYDAKDAADLRANTPLGYKAIPGQFDNRSHRVDLKTGKAIPTGFTPPAGSTVETPTAAGVSAQHASPPVLNKMTFEERLAKLENDVSKLKSK